jgi:hypothetical protein
MSEYENLGWERKSSLGSKEMEMEKERARPDESPEKAGSGWPFTSEWLRIVQNTNYSQMLVEGFSKGNKTGLRSGFDTEQQKEDG